jgi:tungstate transport system ATP-binding protein
MQTAIRENKPIYRLRALVKCYQDREVLAIEGLDIYRGEILALVGPSGAGKSTLLRLLNFLEPPTRGQVEFGGQVFSSESDVSLETRRKVTTVFQNPMLLKRTVWANVIYGLQLRRENHHNDKTIAALELVGLAGLSQQAARTLSGGEAQRVALARAMVLEPEVLLLDEPTANLDPYNVSLIENIIRRTNQENGMTCVLVTHNVFQARRLADRVALMLDGKLVEISPAGDFFDRPRDPRTRAFAQGEMVY